MKIKSDLKIAVLYGGVGQEREISIQSGTCVSRAMQQAGLNAKLCDIRPDDLQCLDDRTIDVFFIVLHGQFGEDGVLQQIMEKKGLCYTGSGPQASRLAFDKLASKRTFLKAGVKTADVVEFCGNVGDKQLLDQIAKLGKKFVVKPVKQGSSVGVSIVDDPIKAVEEAKKCCGEFGDCMIEKFIAGREITVGILCGDVLPIIEIRSQTGFYDYHAKYIDDNTQYLFDTITDKAVIEKADLAAIKAFNALGCRDFARIDFIIGEDNEPYALEANTIPGFTSHSLLPKAAAKIGVPMNRLCMKIIEAAVKRHGR